jgi:type I restriction enzyme S subunit
MSFVALKRLVQNVPDRRLPDESDARYVGLEHIASWTGQLADDSSIRPEGLVGVFRSGDVLFGKLRPYLAKVAAPDFDGVCSTEALILRPRRGISRAFLRYCLSSPSFIDRVNSATFGVKMPRASWENLGRETIWIPSALEQQRIATFLDGETARIDALIEKKARFLNVSAVRWERFVFDVFSGAYSTSADQRDTGLQYFPKVPSAWSLQRLKHLASKITVGIVVTPAAYYVDDGIPALRATNIRPMSIRAEGLVSISAEGHRINSKSSIKAGDVVAVRTGQPGTAAVVPDHLDGANCIDVILIGKTERYNSRLLAYFLNSTAAKAQFALGSNGAIQQHFNVTTAGNLFLPTPPIDEQATIVDMLDSERARVTALELATQASIGRLREYRAALITEAVTGQLGIDAWCKRGSGEAELDRIAAEAGE